MFALFPFLSFSPRQPVRRGTMESVPLEQSATVDELLEACIQAFGWSSEHIEFDSFQMKSAKIHIKDTDLVL